MTDERDGSDARPGLAYREREIELVDGRGLDTPDESDVIGESGPGLDERLTQPEEMAESVGTAGLQRGRDDSRLESEVTYVPPTRHIDVETAELDRIAAIWRRLQEHRLRLAQWELDDSCAACRRGEKPFPLKNHDPYCIIAASARVENLALERLKRALRQHPLWPWLSQHPGLGGGNVALVIGRIGDPRRFPGQRCSEGHYLPSLYAVGESCPVVGNRPENEEHGDDMADRPEVRHGSDVPPGPNQGNDDGPSVGDSPPVCPGVMLEPRPWSGCRAVGHYAGLAPGPDGLLMKRRKGQKVTWNPEVRSAFFKPEGIMDQVVRGQTAYRTIYDQKKAMLMKCVPDAPSDSDGEDGDAHAPEDVSEIESTTGVEQRQGTAEVRNENERGVGRPLTLGHADKIARAYAAKMFLYDLLQEWKRIAERPEAEPVSGVLDGTT